MTSNVGSPIIQKITENNGDAAEMEEAVEIALRARFAPELLNRIDEKIVFRTLDQSEIREIVNLQIEFLKERVLDQNWELNVTAAALDAIAAEGFDPQYGARPLKRVIQQRITNPLASELLKAKKATELKSIEVDFDGKDFFFKI